MRRSSDHVVVLGASMAGLLAARVLAERYQRVTIVERDALPRAGQHRKGVPHGRHLHGLHPRCREILDELFPGFTSELTAAGAVCCDVLADVRWQFSGHLLRQRHAGLPALLASRPFLEGHLRERVFALSGVSVLERCSVAGLMAAPDGREITGARVSDAGGRLTAIEADLVVDATGRGSRTPRWLSELGYQIPAQDRVAFPQVPGSRPAKVRLVNAYLPRPHAAAADDSELALSLIRVIGLKDRPERLLRPGHVLRVLRGNLRRPARPRAAPSPAVPGN